MGSPGSTPPQLDPTFGTGGVATAAVSGAAFAPAVQRDGKVLLSVESWGSLWRRERGSRRERAMLSDWPLPVPRDWV